MRTLGERYFVKGQIPLPCQELASIAFADWCTPVSAGALRFPGSSKVPQTHCSACSCWARRKAQHSDKVKCLKHIAVPAAVGPAARQRQLALRARCCSPEQASCARPSQRLRAPARSLRYSPSVPSGIHGSAKQRTTLLIPAYNQTLWGQTTV